ncbi:glycosyltransferase family 2 protein [Phenylobacterium sp.]|uniref:glycosyltransferase family 2 protein n=1 Tax=Phenylobacterium sp. TaxID=1871053 RepID=UPI00281132E7|nr:glycosyltransferase family 2 protein [Phenylobacterium sp.]
MLSPKPTPERLSETGHSHDRAPLEGRWSEPRSFAPLAGRRGLGEVVAPWPQAWRAMAPDAVIRAPGAEVDTESRAVIIIPCLNEAKAIAGVIARILDDQGLVDPLLLVADGGSTDGTREIVADIAARDPRVRLLHNPRRLQSAGINLAAESLDEARPWMIRVDAHADYPPNYVSTLISEARRTGATSVVVSMDTKGEGVFQRAAAAAQNSVLGTGGSAHRLAGEGRWVDHGHHALFRLDAFEAIGGYDESFSHNEDAELDLRLTREGGRIWLTDKVRIGYHPRSTPGALWKQYFSYGKGRARTVLKHFTPLKIRQTLPLAVAPAVASLAAAPFFWAFAVPALVWMAAALSFGLLLGVRKRDPAAALSGVAAMIMHLAWSAGFWWQLFTDRPKPEPLEARAPLLNRPAIAS